MSATFLQLPHETLEEILLAAIEQTSPGPPSIILSLSLTCRALYNILKYELHSTFYAHIFVQKFDIFAPHSRLMICEMLPGHLRDELQIQYTAIRCFRTVLEEESYDDPQLPGAFRTAYLMLLADDGKNIAQICRAGLPTLLQAYLRRHLFPGADRNNGWPEENEGNSLAVALFWLLASSCEFNEYVMVVHVTHIRDL